MPTTKTTRSVSKKKIISDKQTDKQKVLRKLTKISEEIASKNRGGMADYALLQNTWNQDILARSYDYFPRVSNKLMDIGAFIGAIDIALADEFKEIVCVDHKSYLPRKRPSNVKFHKANIDTSNWTLPSLQKENERYDVIYLVEVIEHLLWSPLPLLKWMQNNTHLAVISTPDDTEWPPMEINPWSRYMHFSSIPSAAPGAKNNPKPMFHCKQYTQTEFVELLTHVGFRLLEFFRVGDGKHQMVAIVQPR
jgi:hypothetical protein